MGKKILKKLELRLVSCLLLMLVSIANTLAYKNELASNQQKTITGTVYNEDRSPLIGATISVKGTTLGTLSDTEGRYTISVPSDNSILVFSFVGFVSQEITVDARNVIDVLLKSSTAYLDEVVVVGYGTQKKANVIGSVATISNEEIVKAPVARISNALSGLLPGAIVQQRSGEPGKDAAEIIIRGINTLGNTSPLVIIDGIQGRDLNSVNTNDVESISILKDASASIFGARAANGVILVTTKRGKEGPAKLNYSFYEGFLSPTKLPEMTDAATYAKMIREHQEYKGEDESNMLFSLEDIEKFRSGEYPWTHPNTNWFEETLAKHSITNHHDLSVNGGTENVSYYLAFGAHYDGGIYKNSSTTYRRYNVRANVDVKINQYLSIGLDLDGSQGSGKYSSQSSYSIFTNGVIRMPPTYPAYYPNGLPGPDLEYGANPVVMATSATGFDNDNSYRTDNKFRATLKMPGIKGLTFSGYYAYDMEFGERKLFIKPWTLYSLDKGAYLAAGNTGKEDGSAFVFGSPKGVSEPRLTNYYSKDRGRNLNLRADYEKTINGIHNINGFVAYESTQFDGQGISAYRRYFLSDQLPYLFAGGDDQKNNSEWVNLDAGVNYFGRITYNYDETYLIEFSYRRDGSLRFSKDSGRWGNFPSILAGWRISNEDFWKGHFDFINYLKIKASWGLLGNDLVDPFQYLAKYGLSTGMVLGIDRQYSYGLRQSGIPNPFITWEKANVYNIGFESRFFKSKMTLNADFFYQRRTDILVKRNASVPNYTGLTLPDENFGIVDNKGFELELGYDEMKGSFTYGVSGNFAFARNSIIEFDEPEQKVPWQVRTGHPQGSQLIYRSLGVFRDIEHVNSYPHVPGAGPGDIIIEDYDKDGKITADDRIILDKTDNPEVTYGLSFYLNYKNWRLTGHFQGVGNAVKRLYFDNRQGTSGNYFKFDAEDRWTPENTDASMPRAYERVQEYWRSTYISDYLFHNVAFTRLKNLQLSYSLPQSLLRTIKINDAQLYFSGQNLFLLYSATKIGDPEIEVLNGYPLMRVLTLGVKLTF